MIDIIATLNDHLYEHEFESHNFGISIGSSGFVIELYEHEEFGSTYMCFDSDDCNFDDDIEEDYENDKIDYNLAVIEQIKRNISKQLDGLVKVNHVLGKM